MGEEKQERRGPSLSFELYDALGSVIIRIARRVKLVICYQNNAAVFLEKELGFGFLFIGLVI